MRYVEARIDEHDREEAYRIYVSRSLQLAPQMKWLTMSYIDFLNGNLPKEEKTGDEVVVDIMTRAGLSFGD